jgi:hypothetical protein
MVNWKIEKRRKMKRVILLLVFALVGLLVVSLTGNPLQAAIPAEERASLIALYNATNGDNWQDISGWKTPPLHTDGFAMPGTENTWYGIVVSDGHVIEIGLVYNDLNGNIPPELGNLSNLKELRLPGRRIIGGISYQLMGNIPAELGNLSNLEWLELSENQLSGNIPPELGNLSNLQHIFLDNNLLSGCIPPELGNLSNLFTLWLDNNQLSGCIPQELGNLSSLKYVSLSSNQLTGNIPTSLINLPYLIIFDISHNCLHTNDPDLRAWLNGYDPDWESYQCIGDIDTPFGSFGTPIDGSTVCSSIPVTGWALDDTGIDSVKIYRQQGNGLEYIGDAVLVEGARPDVAEAYPGYPNNTKAGWGYMMLTNFLPDSGSGTFVIHAVATDFAGKTTTLGTKTIHCDNANAVKPFGAIDTPTQGGSASGGSYVNWGWVLTPQPNCIPTDGSTINVHVNGVNIGHPSYNIYRSDIAALFPQCANTNGAAGYFYLDTTAYENGVHTIQWTARDSSGNSDGIGSRYFSISNTGTSTSSKQSHQTNATPQTPILNISQIAHIPVDYSLPVRVKNGFKEEIEPRFIHADEKGMNRIEIKEVERVQIHLTDDEYDDNTTSQLMSSHSFVGYLAANNRLKPLPVGSTLDSQRGIFYWQPGPGFIGEYWFVFIEKWQNTAISRKNIIVKILPGFQ